MGAVRIQNWKSTLFSLAGTIRFVAFVSIMFHAVSALIKKTPVSISLLLFAVLQLTEVCFRLPYMLSGPDRAGWIQTCVFIVSFFALTVVYAVGIALNGTSH